MRAVGLTSRLRAAAAGCGDQRLPAPDITTPRPPDGRIPTYPARGELVPPCGRAGHQPAGGPIASGDGDGRRSGATRAPSRCPRKAEHAARGQGRAARWGRAEATIARLRICRRRRDASHGRPRRCGARAPRRVRRGGEVVVDAYAPPAAFAAANSAACSAPLLRSLSEPVPAMSPRLMPELPEVETVRRQLAPGWRGARRARWRSSTRAGARPLAPAELVGGASRGGASSALGRRGKYLICALDGGGHLLMHLRMTGTLLYDPAPGRRYAPRRASRSTMGTGWPSSTRAASAPASSRSAPGLEAFFAARLGVEPLGDDFTAEHLRALARGCRAPVKALLLDQRRIAGVGNIYADEALFRARIHPLRPAGRLNARPARRAARARWSRRSQAGIDVRRRDDRRLPRPRRRPRRLPGRVPRPPARGRAVPALRHADRQARRRRARHLRLPALPAAAPSEAHATLRGPCRAR